MRDVRGIVSKKEVAAIVSSCVFESWDRLGIITRVEIFSFFLIYNLCPFDTRDDSLMIRMMIEMIRDQVKLYDFG